MKLLPNHTAKPGLSGSPKGGADAVLLEYSGCTNAGKARPNNEDALLAGTGRDERLFAVADGMGGHDAGEVASFLAVATLERLWPDGSLVGAIRRADRTIFWPSPTAVNGADGLPTFVISTPSLRLADETAAKPFTRSDSL